MSVASLIDVQGALRALNARSMDIATKRSIMRLIRDLSAQKVKLRSSEAKEVAAMLRKPRQKMPPRYYLASIIESQQATIERMQETYSRIYPKMSENQAAALERMADNARELGLDY